MAAHRTVGAGTWLIMRIWILLTAMLCARAEDWPRFLGPRADATSSETNLIETFPAAGPKILWELEVGTGYSAPSVRDGRLILHHR